MLVRLDDVEHMLIDVPLDASADLTESEINAVMDRVLDEAEYGKSDRVGSATAIQLIERSLIMLVLPIISLNTCMRA